MKFSYTLITHKVTGHPSLNEGDMVTVQGGQIDSCQLKFKVD